MKILSSLRMIILVIPVAYAIGQNPHDAWNYTYYRSTDPGGPVFHWVDITTTGSLATGLTDDNNVGPYPMGFTFPWYESGFNTFRIGSNGYITRCSLILQYPVTANSNEEFLTSRNNY